MNSVNLIGRITKDPELRTSSGGKSYVAFTLAVNEFGGGNQYTQFIPCFAWEKTAENMARYVKKGAQISVEGNINVRQDNNNGQYSTVVSIRANRVQFLGANQAGGMNVSQSNSQPEMSRPQTNNYDFDLVEDNKPSNDDDSILWED
ncbi:single-stranded DNA-binding protein [Spiroplasma tabanidicola]|uniref:Single-stranded DNA-binding protein n=1 Tax=Spiroplasma tabanidicola TaxID=324079 RepID=A0A6I6C5H9_9MOLU|nr:single-stranded DNA-binding protein [Spiroplasma tabanidicola]QGS51390.1 single-strand DNA-binding protein [Spiroplasma tabanidicola]